ncbi:MAG: hypothetical protein Tsb0021_16810 [Chlamydiales bacterium]
MDPTNYQEFLKWQNSCNSTNVFDTITCETRTTYDMRVGNPPPGAVAYMHAVQEQNRQENERLIQLTREQNERHYKSLHEDLYTNTFKSTFGNNNKW